MSKNVKLKRSNGANGSFTEYTPETVKAQILKDSTTALSSTGAAMLGLSGIGAGESDYLRANGSALTPLTNTEVRTNISAAAVGHGHKISDITAAWGTWEEVADPGGALPWDDYALSDGLLAVDAPYASTLYFTYGGSYFHVVGYTARDYSELTLAEALDTKVPLINGEIPYANFPTYLRSSMQLIDVKNTNFDTDVFQQSKKGAYVVVTADVTLTDNGGYGTISSGDDGGEYDQDFPVSLEAGDWVVLLNDPGQKNYEIAIINNHYDGAGTGYTGVVSLTDAGTRTHRYQLNDDHTLSEVLDEAALKDFIKDISYSEEYDATWGTWEEVALAPGGALPWDDYALSDGLLAVDAPYASTQYFTYGGLYFHVVGYTATMPSIISMRFSTGFQSGPSTSQTGSEGEFVLNISNGNIIECTGVSFGTPITYTWETAGSITNWNTRVDHASGLLRGAVYTINDRPYVMRWNSTYTTSGTLYYEPRLENDLVFELS